MGTTNRKLSTDKYKERCIKVYGDKYDLSKVDYKGAFSPVLIGCKKHGFIEVIASRFISNKKGCPKCGLESRFLTNEQFIEISSIKHNGKYNYSKSIYSGEKNKVEIICPLHGSFWQRAGDHSRGSGCPICSGKQKITTEIFIDQSRKVHGDKFDYSKVKYERDDKKVEIICPIHGSFWQTPSNHKSGFGCWTCRNEFNCKINTKSQGQFIIDAKKVHGDRFSYDKVVYEHSRRNVIITCPIHGDFPQLPNNHLKGYDCPYCARGSITSKVEKNLVEFVSEFCEVETNKRDIISPYEVDIYIPDKKVAIEFNGLFWHSDIKKRKDYHIAKTNSADKNGIQLIHIFEDEWMYKNDIVKSRIKNIIGVTDTKLYARNLKVEIVDNKIAKEFLNNNHIQGVAYGKDMVCLGLNNKDGVLRSVMTFCRPRINLGNKSYSGDSWELLRFCNEVNCTVVGGASKLLAYFIKSFSPKEITSYADRRWSIGNLYEKMGFTKVGYTPPNYFYIKGTSRYNRFKFRKSELIKMGHDPSKSESEIMSELRYNRIYDCGNIKYVLNLV